MTDTPNPQLEAAIRSGQVSARQVVAHHRAGEYRPVPAAPTK